MKYDDVAAAWVSIAACTACSSAVSLLISSLCGVDGDGDDEDAEDDDVVDGNDAAGAGSSSMHFASMSAGSISSPSQSKSSWLHHEGRMMFWRSYCCKLRVCGVVVFFSSSRN